MQIDRKALEGLLTMNDKQLGTVINRLLKESGINPSQFNIDPKDIASIRTALAGATDEELKNVVAMYEANKKSRGGGK